MTTPKNDDLAARQLTADTFPTFYKEVMHLRFPLEVADVIEIRDTVNHAAETFRAPPPKQGHRRFRRALRSIIDTIGIDSQHRTDKLIHILTMIRNLHHVNGFRSRYAELTLRQRQAANRNARRISKEYGFFALIATTILCLAWLGMAEPTWVIKAGTVILAYISWDYFHSLTTLDREYEILTGELDGVLRERIYTINWKGLVHKLALILGYKRSEGVDVFLMSQEDNDVMSPEYTSASDTVQLDRLPSGQLQPAS